MALRMYQGGPTDGGRVIRMLTALSRPSVGYGGLIIGTLKEVQPFVDKGLAEFWPKEGGRAPATYAAAVAPYKNPIGDFGKVRAEARASKAAQDEDDAGDGAQDDAGDGDKDKATSPPPPPPGKKTSAKKTPAKKPAPKKPAAK